MTVKNALHVITITHYFDQTRRIILLHFVHIWTALSFDIVSVSENFWNAKSNTISYCNNYLNWRREGVSKALKELTVEV